MKKWAVGLFSAALILGAGTAVFAAGNNSEDGFSFQEMLPFMEKMHPDSSKADLEKMYNACHKDGGMMGETEGMNSENMMNRF